MNRFDSQVAIRAYLFGLVIVISCLGIRHSQLCAQEPGAKENDLSHESLVSPLESPPGEVLTAEEIEHKRRYAQVAMLLLWGIVILGVFLIVMALVIGRRYRRIAASGPKRTPPPDPFWYLKDPGQKTEPRDDDFDGTAGGGTVSDSGDGDGDGGD